MPSAASQLPDKLVPVRLFFDSPPLSPFFLFLCNGKKTGNHTAGMSFRTVILNLFKSAHSSDVSWFRDMSDSLTATSPQGRGDEAPVPTPAELNWQEHPIPASVQLLPSQKCTQGQDTHQTPAKTFYVFSFYLFIFLNVSEQLYWFNSGWLLSLSGCRFLS